MLKNRYLGSRSTLLMILTAVAVATLSVLAGLDDAPPTEELKNEIHGFIYTKVSGGKMKFLPEVTVYATNLQTGFESGRVQTDCRGRFVVPRVPAGNYSICWEEDGFVDGCSSSPASVGSTIAYPLPYRIFPEVGTAVFGTVALADASLAAYSDPGSGISETTTMSVLDAVSLEPVRRVDLGRCGRDFAFAGLAPGDYVLKAQYAGQTVVAELDGPRAELTFPTSRPSVQAIFASVGGVGVRRAAPGSTVQVTVEANDPDGDDLSFVWNANDGQIETTRDPAVALWTLGFGPTQNLEVVADDGRGGFARRRLTLSTDQAVRFTGRVVGEQDRPLAGATVRINGEGLETGEDGTFALSRFEDEGRFVLTIQQSGYMLYSRIYESAQIGRTYRLTPASRFQIDPRRPSRVMLEGPKGQSAGVAFQPGTLVSPEGKPANGPLDVLIGVVDPGDPNAGMPGDYGGINREGRTVALSSFGAISVSIEDGAGTEYNLRPGSVAEVSIPIPEAKLALGELPESVPLWIYNEDTGAWEEVSEAFRSGNVYVGNVPHFSEINADVEFTNPVCIRLLVDASLQSQLPFDIRIEVIPTGDVLTKEVDQIANSIYRLPELSDVEVVVLDSQGTPIEGTRQTITTGPYAAGCDPPPYPYTCCTATATLSLDIPPTSGFLDYSGLSDVFEALWYTSVIDPVAATDVGTASTSVGGTTVTGVGTSFTTFFVPGDLIRPAAVAGTGTVDSSVGSFTVTGTGTAFTTFFQVGDILSAAGQTRVITSISSDTSLAVNSPFDPVLASASFDRHEVRLVESVASNTSLDVNEGFNHAQAGVTYEKVGERPTLADFESLNGLGTPDSEAVYYNGGDLGFGRYMKKKTTGTDVAYAVANYGTPGIFDPTQVVLAQLAAQGIFDNRFATVTMEHTPSPTAGGLPYTKFFVYRADGKRVLDADLDGLGAKFVPELCVICHGGSTSQADSRGDIEAEFLPFDLPTFEYSGAVGFTRADQEPEFKDLNKGIRDFTTPTPALQDMIEESYGGSLMLSPTFDDTWVPAAWSGGLNEIEVYNFVNKKSCRGCHITRQSPIDWATYADFDFYDSIGFLESIICSSNDMPNALLTYTNMWLSTSPHQPNVLANEFGWASCP